MTEIDQRADVVEPPLGTPPDHPPGPVTPGCSNNFAVPAPVEAPPPEPPVADSNARASRVEEDA